MNFSILITEVHDVDFLLAARMRKGYRRPGKRIYIYLESLYVSYALFCDIDT
jgi:hypothetical protein